MHENTLLKIWGIKTDEKNNENDYIEQSLMKQPI